MLANVGVNFSELMPSRGEILRQREVPEFDALIGCKAGDVQNADGICTTYPAPDAQVHREWSVIDAQGSDTPLPREEELPGPGDSEVPQGISNGHAASVTARERCCANAKENECVFDR